MSALLEEAPVENLDGTIDGFEIAKVSIEHPQVRALVDAFFAKMHIAPFPHPPWVRWFALTQNDTIYCTVGAFTRPDRSIEITDIYARPCREGVRAATLTLDFFKTLVDAGRIPYVVGVILERNKTGQRHFERAFHKGNASRVYIYERA